MQGRLKAANSGEIEAEQCSQSCSTEFVNECVPFKFYSEQGMESRTAYESCRSDLDEGHEDMVRQGCVSGCADQS